MLLKRALSDEQRNRVLSRNFVAFVAQSSAHSV